jgi:hypothetical protein
MKSPRLNRFAATSMVTCLMGAASCTSFVFTLAAADPERSAFPAFALVVASSATIGYVGLRACHEKPHSSMTAVRFSAFILSIPFIWLTLLFWDVNSLGDLISRIVAKFSGGLAALSVLGVMEFRQLRHRYVRATLIILTAAIPIAVCVTRLSLLEATRASVP